MGKAVLISIQPKWCELIVSGKKTIEVRKTRPKFKTPFKCYIYCTYGKGLIERSDLCLPNMLIEQKVTKEKTWGNCCNGKVIGEFVCDRIDRIARIGYSGNGEHPRYHTRVSDFRVVPSVETFSDACLSESEAEAYLNGSIGYGWHISGLVIFEKPKELTEFMKPCESDLYCEVCAMFREFEDQCGNKALMISRAPQSWCYVEELKGGEG